MIRKVFKSICILAVCMLALVLSGCRSQAPVSVRQDTDSTGTTVLQRETDLVLSELVRQQIRDVYSSWMDRLVSTSGEWTREEYSPPDSSGTQYKISTTTGKFERREEEQRRDSMQTEREQEAVQNTVSSIDEDVESNSRVVSNLTAERKASITWWQAALMFLGVILVVIIAWKLLRRKLP